MKCLSNEDGTVRLRHPLFPAVRTWYLRETTIAEAMQTISEEQPYKSTKSTGKPKKLSKEKLPASHSVGRGAYIGGS